MKSIPNILTVFRIILVGVYVYFFLHGQYALSIATYAVAFFSDVLDGYLARRNNWITKIGKVLDPLADKLLLLAVLVCFFIDNRLDLWILIAFSALEFLQIAVASILFLKKIVVYSDWFGKIATGLFAISIAMTYCNILWGMFNQYRYAYIVTLTATFIACVHYGINTIKHHYR